MRYQIDENNTIIGIIYDKDVDIVLDTNINYGIDRFIGGTVIKGSVDDLIAKKTKSDMVIRSLSEINSIKEWFRWYDIQVSQALRSDRLGNEWSASDGNKNYSSLLELDYEANMKQMRIRELYTIATR